MIYSSSSFTLPARPPNLHQAVLCLVPGEDEQPPAGCGVVVEITLRLLFTVNQTLRQRGQKVKQREDELECAFLLRIFIIVTEIILSKPKSGAFTCAPLSCCGVCLDATCAHAHTRVPNSGFTI